MKKNIITGLVTIAAIAILYWGFNFLKGKNVFDNDYRLYAKYENVQGLLKSNPIMLNGVKIGLVEDIFFSPQHDGTIVVSFLITNTFPIPTNSEAKIFSKDLMGSKAVTIVVGNSPALCSDGDTLVSSVEASLKEELNAQVIPIKLKAENMISSMDSVLVAFNSIFNKQTKRDIQASLHNMQISFRNLASITSNADTLIVKQRKTLEEILMNAASISRNLEENNDNITAILSNFRTISDSLEQANIPKTVTEVQETFAHMNIILQHIENGNGTIGQLLYNDTLYIELEKSAKDLNLLLEDIKANPKKYVKLSLF